MLCSYCFERTIHPAYTAACLACSFTCESCGELTGYDRGVSRDEMCDDCGARAEATQ